MENNSYIIASVKKWHENEFKKIKKKLRGEWYFIGNYEELTLENILKINPTYIFFPHWSKKVPENIFNKFECVCFHETDLPYGRGGSPIQNLILRNQKKTIITALKMTDKIDAGPIYLKKQLKLNGSAQQIYERASKKVYKMISIIVKKKIMPIAQKGNVVRFNRRKPKQSILSKKTKSLSELYNHIRMLDAKSYPTAFIKYGNLRIEFKKAKINKKTLNASVSIKIKKNDIKI